MRRIQLSTGETFRGQYKLSTENIKVLDVQIIVLFPQFSEGICYLKKNLEEYANLSGDVC